MRARAESWRSVKLALAALAVAALSGGAWAQERTITWAYFAGGVSSPGAVIGSDKTLEAQIPARLKFVQINSGVAALAAMRAGSFDVVEGVGNPPVVSSLAARTPLTVVFAESFDGAALYVNGEVLHQVSDLAGQKIGDLVGSSEDYELQGYLEKNGLKGRVQVVPFASDAAAAAAFLAGNLNAVYVDFGAGVPLAAKPGTKIWTDAAKIAEMGFPSMNVLVVSRDLAAKDKALVQKIVCAVAAASDDMVGADRTKYFTASAPLLGVPVDVAIKGSSDWPELTLKQQAEWMGAPGSKIADSKIVQEAYVKSGKFLKDSGKVMSVPSTAEIAAAVDPSFVHAALDGACR